MCNNFPTIKIVERNAFALLLPLKSRTYESCEAIDEDIDCTQLTDVVFKLGSVQYPVELGADGVRVIIPATLAKGIYDIELTATYYGSLIRAAYESAIQVVSWNSQSDAQQYLPGSPVTINGAYIIGGAMTDAELEALKQEYREKNAQLDQAIAEYERRAAELDGVAQQGSDPNATNTAILQAIQQSGGDDVAKESTSQDILQKVQNILSANILRTNADGWIFNTQHEPENDKLANLIQYAYWAEEIHDDSATVFGTSLSVLVSSAMPNLRLAEFTNVDIVLGNVTGTAIHQYMQPNGSLVLKFPNATTFGPSGRAFSSCTGLRSVQMPRCTIFTSANEDFSTCWYLEDIEVGAISTSFRLSSWWPANVSQTVYLQNIKNHIAARIADLTGRPSQTITFSSLVKNSILQDQELVDMFINKNWTIA